MKVLFLGSSPYLRDEHVRLQHELVGALGAEVRVHVPSTLPDDPGAADVLVCQSGCRIGAAEVAALRPALELVVTTTSGHDHIDIAAATAAGVRVARCPLGRRDPVVDTSVALAMALLRRLPELNDAGRAGQWVRGTLGQRRLGIVRGLAVGVVGAAGVIGARAAEVWEAVGARVLRCDPRLEDGLPLDELVARSAVLTLHCALTAETRGIVGAERLARMPDGAILVNTARGGLVDVDALAGADHLGGIGLDVFPEEPFPGIAALAARPNVLVTPHAAGVWDGLGDSVAHELADTLRAWCDDRTLPHEVRPTP